MYSWLVAELAALSHCLLTHTVDNYHTIYKRICVGLIPDSVGFLVILSAEACYLRSILFGIVTGTAP